jgi:hypothetical protein
VLGVHDKVPESTILSKVRYLFFGTLKLNVITVLVAPGFGVNVLPDKLPFDMLKVGTEVPPEPPDENTMVRPLYPEIATSLLCQVHV